MKKIAFVIIAIIVVVTALTIIKPMDKIDDLSLNTSDFFPNRVMTKKFSGGFENEGFTHIIDKVQGNRIQVKQVDTGVDVVLVYEVSKENIKLIYSHEIYDINFEENYVEDIKPNRQDMIIQAPIEKGTKWTDNEGRVYEITGTEVKLTTPAGTFDTLEITSIIDDFQVKSYYAKGIGLVKRIFGDIVDELIEIKYSVDEEVLSDFSIRAKDKHISLRGHYTNLSEILGSPISEEVEVLGEGADTFTGSRIKKSTYDGLRIEEFSPEKEGNDNFWILSMTITNENYSTEKGLTVGDSLEKIKEIYENIETLKDSRTDPNNCSYIYADITGINFIEFEVKDGVINEIKIYHQLQ